MPGYGSSAGWNWEELTKGFTNQAVDPNFEDPTFWEALIELAPEAFEAQGMKWEPEKFVPNENGGELPRDVISDLKAYAYAQRESARNKKPFAPEPKPTVGDWFKDKFLGSMTTAENASRLWSHWNPNK